MERVGSRCGSCPGQEAEYRRRHAAVWPEMLDALQGRRRPRLLDLHPRRPTCSPTSRSTTSPRSARRWRRAPVNDRWQAEMAALIDPLTDPATGFHQRLEEIFHLD